MDKKSVSRSWCDVCRGDLDGDSRKCPGCPRRFHVECVRQSDSNTKDWRCDSCTHEEDSDDPDRKTKAQTVAKRNAAVRKIHKNLREKSFHFLEREREALAPFVTQAHFQKLLSAKRPAALASARDVQHIEPAASYVQAELRDYQVEGVNWMIDQYNSGVGGILGDEMGLGKTIQTLSFLASLKAHGLPGPHLIVTPLAVLINWTNEIKKFTPAVHCLARRAFGGEFSLNECAPVIGTGLSFIKVHGSMQERDRILSDPKVLAGEYDLYLTTYETVMSEEAFFSETLIWHTIVIDESLPRFPTVQPNIAALPRGHRLKNENSGLCQSLGRTPLQNNLHELWALLNYVMPNMLSKSSEVFDKGCNVDQGEVDTSIVSHARLLLDSLMIRRIKAEVEKSLLPKLEYTLKVPLTPLQRKWYQRFLSRDTTDMSGLMSTNQLQMLILQLQKVCNHPKCVLFQYHRDQEKAKSFEKRAAGSEFVKVPKVLLPLGADAATMHQLREFLSFRTQRGSWVVYRVTRLCDVLSAAVTALQSSPSVCQELGSLYGDKLISASGKLALLDRLLDREISNGSRVLIFSQFTLTLDALTEYCLQKFGAAGFFRLDGSTNRIVREMNVRSFNGRDSKAVVYLISTRAGGQGINLATADRVVLYDTCWNPQIDLQAQDRAHRIGQKKQVKVFRMISEDSMEERVLARARQKQLLAAEVIKGGGGSNMPDKPDGSKDDELTLNEMWSILQCGAERILDPSTNNASHELSASDYDLIIDNAKSGIELEHFDDQPESAEPPNEATLSGSIFEFRAPATKAQPQIDTVDSVAEPVAAAGSKKLSPYMLFCKAERENVRLKDKDQPLKFGEVGRALGVAWKQLSDSAKAKYVDMAQQLSCPVTKSSEHETGVDVTCNGVNAVFLPSERLILTEPGIKLKPAEFEASVGFGYKKNWKTSILCVDSGTPLKERLCELYKSCLGQPKPGSEAAAPVLCSGKRTRTAPKRFVPPEYRQEASTKKKLKNLTCCFMCNRGAQSDADMISCDQCPMAYHLRCLGLDAAPKGCFRCPWHACLECERRSSSVGGMLFHCTSCPKAYCFDCAPEQYLAPEKQDSYSSEAAKIGKALEHSGCSSKNYMWIKCDDCEQQRKYIPLEATRIVNEAARRQPKIAAPKVVAGLLVHQDAPVPMPSLATTAATTINRQSIAAGHSKDAEVIVLSSDSDSDADYAGESNKRQITCLANRATVVICHTDWLNKRWKCTLYDNNSQMH